jgi:hypothetical protein
MKMNKSLAVALPALLILTSLAAAGEPVPAQLETCAALHRDAERLACYDKAIALMRAGEAGAQAAPSAENMFGANSDTLSAKGNLPDVKREELRQISGSVTSLRRIDDGMIQVELDNGQVWRQQDADVKLALSIGDKVSIVRAALGTFRLTDKTGRFARFKRVR